MGKSPAKGRRRFMAASRQGVRAPGQARLHELVAGHAPEFHGLRPAVVALICAAGISFISLSLFGTEQFPLEAAAMKAGFDPKNALILAEPEPKVYVSKHLDSGVEITVFVWTMQENYFAVQFRMEEDVKNAFDENGVTIPYPHVEIVGKNA